MRKTIPVLNYVLSLPFIILGITLLKIPHVRLGEAYLASLVLALLFSIPQIIICIKSLSDRKNKIASICGILLGLAVLCLSAYTITHIELH
jgi:D-alanyl-lipoteichoic acid acyltransferase DltB (MBOAT superfamily)